MSKELREQVTQLSIECDDHWRWRRKMGVEAEVAQARIAKLEDEIKWYRAALEEIEALASMVDEDSAYADRAYDALRRGSVSNRGGKP